MFDKKQKSCVKRIHLVTDGGLYERKAFHKVKIVFYSSSKKYLKSTPSNFPKYFEFFKGMFLSYNFKKTIVIFKIKLLNLSM